MNTVFSILLLLVLAYAIAICLSYILLSVLSVNALKKYLRKNSYIDFRNILSSPIVPSISVIAPAYNEGLSIVDNVRSLLSLHYSNFEVVIVNDGSKDDSLQKLINAFALEAVPYAFDVLVPSREIKAVYKSTNPAYRQLVVIDKVNGGKADALNAGVNVATGRYIACIDVDCVLEYEALLRMVKPFMEETEERVIASGGVIRIANSCIVKDGRLVKINLPENRLARFQVLEYMRSFLLGRMAWSRLNGLLLISGAFGLFDRELVIKVGGYDHRTVGEDMELVVRMRRYMEENKLKYKVTFIPDPLCWTEAPSSDKVFIRQRNRWTRGTIETLRFHKKMFLNPKYGILGMLSFPYWTFFEWLAPLFEFFGLIITLLLFIFGFLDIEMFLLLFACLYTFAVTVSLFTLWVDQHTYHQYKARGEQSKLVIAACLEPFLFHPLVVWAAIKGNYDYITGKNSWGVMTRTGFSQGK